MKRGAGPAKIRFPHDFWVAPGGFDLESATAFIEPGAPLIPMHVFELELFMAPDERGTSLRGRIGSGEKGHMNKETYWSWQVSQFPAPVPPNVDEGEHERNR